MSLHTTYDLPEITHCHKAQNQLMFCWAAILLFDILQEHYL